MLDIKLTLDDAVLRRITKELQPQASTVVRKTAYAIEGRAKASMSGPKSGRLYPRSGGRVHQASAPGEAPAVDYGMLANSIQTTFAFGGLTGFASSNMEYATMLEFGTMRKARRPFFGPAANAERGDFVQAMKKIIK